MKRRAVARRFFEYALVATIVCLIPPVLWSEWTAPAGLEPTPSIVPWQWTLFTVVVSPPARISDTLHLSENAYGCVVGVFRCCWLPIVRPLEAARGFWHVAFPFWLLAITGTGELSLKPGAATRARTCGPDSRDRRAPTPPAR